MNLKKIDVKSKGFAIFRHSVGVIGGVGIDYGVATILGALYKAFGGKKIGLIPFAIGCGAVCGNIAMNTIDIIEDDIQSWALAWNEFVDARNSTVEVVEEEPEQENDIPENQTQIPESQLWPEPVGRDDLEELNDWIVKWKIFEFNKRETAENTFEFLKKHEQFFVSMHGNQGYITLRDYIQCRITCDERFAFIMTDGVLEKMKDYLDIYGWSVEKIANAYIDPLIEGTEDDSMEGVSKYILVLQNYAFLGILYNIHK